MFKKEKNTYTPIKIVNSNNEKYNSNIHQRALKINQYVWDMIKFLNKNELYGFKLESKMGTAKIIITLNHTNKELLKEAKDLIRKFQEDEMIILTKHIEKKKNNFIRNFYIFFSISLLIVLAIYTAYNYYFGQENKHSIVTDKLTKSKQASKEPIIQKIEIDSKKLLALQEVFMEEDKYDDIKKVMTLTTDIISISVSDEEKKKYSNETLVKNFKGKSGFQFVLNEDNNSKEYQENIESLNNTSKEFISNNHKELSKVTDNYLKNNLKETNQSSGKQLTSLLSKDKDFQDFIKKDNNKQTLNMNFQELNTVATAFKKQNNITMADACYTKILRDFNLTNEEEGFIHIQKALISLDKNESISAKKSYNLALKIYTDLSNKNFEKFSSQESWILEQLLTFQKNKEMKKKFLNKIENIYLKKIKEYSKKRTIVYKEKLAMELYHFSNFQLKYRDNIDKAIKLNIKSFQTYKKINFNKYLKILFGLTNKYNFLEQYQESEKLCLNVLKEIKNSTKNKIYIAKVQNHLANIYTKDSELKKAKVYYDKSLEIYKKLIVIDFNKYKPMHLKIERDIVQYEQKIGKFNEAKKHYIKILYAYKKLSKQTDTRYYIEMAQTWNEFAKMIFRKKDSASFNQIKEYLENSLALSKKVLYKEYREASKVQSKSYFYLALLSNLENNFQDAHTYYLNALDKDESFLIALNYANFLRENEQYSEGQKQYKKLLKRYQQKNKLAKIFMEYGKFSLTISPEAAIRRLNKALNIYKELSKKYKKKYPETLKIQEILKSPISKD